MNINLYCDFHAYKDCGRKVSVVTWTVVAMHTRIAAIKSVCNIECTVVYLLISVLDRDVYHNHLDREVKGEVAL